ncbi:hypothetical protein [Noviherbaspirillum malthae]|jgi:NAD(P)H-flavin reductase|uniref:hypothetical protein n=1 Tax=Noviherbaspirillum malthae TaxID=1260987 RepID=UPI00188EADCF|nr:hypothetical protein [Noviherbaspirillum malthae]
MEIGACPFVNFDPNKHQKAKAMVYRGNCVTDNLNRSRLCFPANTRVRFEANGYVQSVIEDSERCVSSMDNPQHQSDYVQLHISHVPYGRFTSYPRSNVPQDDKLELPFADFWLRDIGNKPLIFVASSTGFALPEESFRNAFVVEAETCAVPAMTPS